jgi:proliferating cell nuclear antigen
MFTARLNDGTILKRIVDSIKDLVQDVNLDISSSGISLQAMDSSHVALVQLHLAHTGFQTYTVERNMTIGLSIQNLAKVMKLVNANDSITLKCGRGTNDSEEPQNIQIICESNRAEGRTTEFSLNLISLDSEALGIPETTYSSEITMNSMEFSKLCKELYALSETVSFEITSNFVKFAVEGEVGSGSIKIQTGGHAPAATKEEDGEDADKNAVTLSFALRYLNLFNKAYNLSNEVRISMSPDTPLCVEYNMSDKMGSLKFYLAPKISEDVQ